MTDTLLQTKLFVPPLRPNLVSRLQLIESLNQGLHLGRKLTLISAPAGFGKTTLVSEWVQELGGLDPPVAIAWLSLDESDNDLARFLSYVIAALKQVIGTENTIGQGALSMLQSPQPPPAEPVLTSLLNDLTNISGRIILILDDFHLIDSSPVDEAVAFLLEYLPPQIHLVIVTRIDPNLALARLRARGQLTELRASDLRFTASEVTEFLNREMGLDLSADDIVTLESRTEGWIAGLQLAALALRGAISLRGHQDATGFIKSFSGSHHFVLDYLIEEVLEQQPENVQQFLLKTSILNRLTGSLCDTLTGDGDGQMTLEMLDHANLFIIPLDGERRWYRYHHLFTDLLRQRLAQTRPDWAQKLHRQASKWYEGNEFAGEAIEHALLAEDFERAAELIEGLVDHVLHFGEHTKLRRWLAEIPLEVIYTKPYLCILHAGNLFISGQIEKAERYIQRAEQALELSPAAGSDAGLVDADQRPDRDKMKLRGRMSTIRSYLVAYHGDEEAAIRYARQALEALPKSDFTWRSSAFDSLGTAYNATDVVAAYQARREAVVASKAAGNAYMILFASLRLVVTQRDLGRLEQAVEICRQQLEEANDNGLSQTALVGWLFTLWAEILAEKNELDSALRLVNKGVALTGRGNDVTLLGSGYLCLMRVLFSRGELDQAAATIQEVNDFAPKHRLSPWIMDQMAAWGARIWLAQDKLDAAAGWAEELGPDVNEELDPMHDYAYGVLARILVAQGRLDEASRLLQRLFEAAESGGRMAKMLEIMALQSLTFQAQGEGDRALDVLERALTLAEPEGFIRVFMDEGRPMARLLHRALNCGIAPEYVRRLLAGESPKESRPADPVRFRDGQSGLVEPLSEREIEVLQRIAEGLTNREIADRLYLALNTVKVHTRNIYGKLGVNNRTGAVARARDLGLLSRS